MCRSFSSYVLSGILIVSILTGLPFASFAEDMAAMATNSPEAASPAVNTPVPVATSGTLYAFKVKSLAGEPVDLSQYVGHVTLVVNSSSKGFYAQQLIGLEKLYEDNKDKGFVVLAFPCNDFGRMDPGNPEETSAAYAAYKVSFPIFEKITLRGSGQSPVYQFLTTGRDVPTWNFHKYLIDKTGKVIGDFPSQTAPDDKDLLAAIAAALKG